MSKKKPPLTLAEFARRMAPKWERDRLCMLGEYGPDLFGAALRNATETLRGRGFWL